MGFSGRGLILVEICLILPVRRGLLGGSGRLILARDGKLDRGSSMEPSVFRPSSGSVWPVSGPIILSSDAASFSSPSTTVSA